MVRTFQITQPFARLTVLENIMVGAQLRSGDRREAQRQALEIGKKVGMGSYLNMRAEDLTVAARKRLELARALATGPQLLLLDEVMAGLNPTEVSQIVAALRSVRDEGVTILLIEHVMQVVMSLAETVYVLNNGRVLSSGTPNQIAKDRKVIEAYLGEGAAARMLNEGRPDAGS
jgi:branched-chain amino acid transport system ATP-binding protein